MCEGEEVWGGGGGGYIETPEAMRPTAAKSQNKNDSELSSTTVAGCGIKSVVVAVARAVVVVGRRVVVVAKVVVPPGAVVEVGRRGEDVDVVPVPFTDVALAPAVVVAAAVALDSSVVVGPVAGSAVVVEVEVRIVLGSWSDMRKVSGARFE